MNLFGLSITRAQPVETKASSTSPLIWRHKVGAPVYTPRRYDRFAEIGYGQNPIVWSAVRKIAEAVARVPYLLYSDEGDARKEIEQHPLLALMKRPNGAQSWADFTRAVVSYRLLSGNSFLERVDVGGMPKELHALRPDRMQIRAADKTGSRLIYRYTVNGFWREWTCDMDRGEVPLWHWKSFHPTDDYWGMSALDPAMRSVDTFGAHLDHNMALLQNAATPSGAFKYAPENGGQGGTGRMPADMLANLKTMVDERFRSGKNAGKPLVLEGGLDWVPFGMSPEELQTIEGQNMAARLIALAFGVPPQLLGIPGDSTYSNYQEANADFHRSTVLPMCDDLYSTLTRWLAPAFGDAEGKLVLAFDEDEIPALAEVREKKWQRIEQSTVLTINEKREALGYTAMKVDEAADDHDKIMTSGALTPVGGSPDGMEMGFDPMLEDPPIDEPPAKANGKANGAAIQ